MRTPVLSRRTLAAVGLFLPATKAAHAQDAYPTRPVRMLVPFAAGGSTDILQREVQALFAELGARPVGGTPEEMQRFLRVEAERWAGVIHRSGATAN